MPASSTYLQSFLVVLLLTEVINGARISQRLVGGHAKVEQSNTNKNEEPAEEKKTLSQQVAEGKYGLIQKELFEKTPKRPGVLSYENNADVPKDNENSLGGLGPDEIWLAEDHLLVLKGGSFHRTASELPWPPIDDYRAPNRQVKIPSQPKVPPPFPVQLSEGGPLQFFGLNITRAPNGSLAIPGADGAPPIFFPLPPDGSQHSSNASTGGTPFPLPPYIIGDGPENFNRGNGPSPPFPFPYPFPNPPPSQPPQNQSLDEDDPSIYYPPPYSFFYPKDNSSKVPPGPLVPGIVLPPPPDFFAPLDPITTTTSSTTTATTSTTTTPLPTTTRTIAPPRTHIIVTEAPPKPPIRYLPYDNSKTKYDYNPPTVTTKPHLINFQEVSIHENELTNTRNQPTTSRPEHIIRIPVVQVLKDQRPRTRLRPTNSPAHAPVTTPTVYFSEEFEAKDKQQPSRVMVPPFEPTVTTILRPTTVSQPIPVVQISYGGGNGNQRPRTYLKPATGSSISNTVSPVPVLQAPYQSQRTYLKPTGGPQTSPISVYLPYNSNKRVKPTSVSQTPSVATVPVIRVPSRTQVSSTAVPLKTYYSDVNTNSVQPQAEYYFYEEDSTPPSHQSNNQHQHQHQHQQLNQQQIPQRLRYVAPSNFEKHIQQLRQQIQSYLKPAARPVYEYSFQAANYRPTRPPTRYLTPAPQQYINQRPRYQPEREQDQAAYYTKQDERLLDDITKKYFTVFGQKITTPVTPQLSLAGDTLVNYRKAHPTNHESEYINIRPQQPHKQSPGEPGTFISYALPGEGAHFYFLTPQLVQQQRQQQLQLQQQQQQEQQNAYYYEKPETPSRIRRRNQR